MGVTGVSVLWRQGRGFASSPRAATPMAIATTVHSMRTCFEKKMVKLRDRPGPAPISSGRNGSRNRASPEPDNGSLLLRSVFVMSVGWCAT